MRFQAELSVTGGTDPFMSVNVAAGQLYHHREAQALLDTIARAGATPQQIKLEITETALLDDPQAAARAMELLRDRAFAWP